MKKKISIIATALILGPIVALAALPDSVKERRENAKEAIQEKRAQFKDDLKQKREDVKAELIDKRGKLKDKASLEREKLRAAMEKRKQEFEAKKESIKMELEAKREKFKDDAANRKQQLKKKLGERRAQNIEKYFGQMSEKFSNAVEKLKKFADTIEERIQKTEANGKDMTDAKDKLITARTKISDAQVALEDAKAGYSQAAQGADFKASFQQVRDLVNKVSQKVKEGHAGLVDVVKSMKGLGGGENTASTTPSLEISTTTSQ